MPVYNGENYISQAIDSILAQTYENFELIISDNASTDKTESICRKYASKDQRIFYYRNKQNLGAAPNYNRVFELSRGKYFKWASHDDLCAPEFLERCVDVLEKDPSVVLCFSRTVVIDEHGQFLRSYSNNLDLSSTKPYERFKQYHCRLRSFTACDPIFGVIRRNKFKTTSLIGNYISSDMTLLGELALLGKFYEVPEYLFSRRNHSQMSVQANYDWDKRILWFNPEKKGKLLFPHWSLFLSYISAINRVQINLYEKIKCYFFMNKLFLEQRNLFVKELIINIGRALNIRSISFGSLQKNLPTVW